ncbi:MAG: pilus assembly protein TadG-related protein, partial [Candidatus Acidiferrales bacterium]
MTRKSESGQALVFTALALVVLLGFAGLAIDMGTLRYQKRLQQSAADAAAIAGASNLASSSGGVSAGAVAASATNGFSAGSAGSGCPPPAPATTVGSVAVAVNNPPCSGPHNGDGKYVEVYVSEVQPTYFMSIFGVNSETITARAVATNLSGGNGGGCLYTLGPPSSSIEGVNINGNATLNGPSCGIVDNGNFNTKGNSLTVTAGTFGVSGDWDKSGPGGTVTCGPTQPTCPATDVPAATDPMLNRTTALTPPCSPCTGGGTWAAGDGPGTYSSISIGPATVTFSPGVYVIDGSGGFSIGANATVSGTGVMFYFTNGATLNMAGTPTVNLTAPSSGQYAGILFYQDPNDTVGPVITGNASSTYDGVLYFPTANVTFQGNSSIGDVAIVIADALTLSGHPTVNLQGIAGLPSGVSVITNAVLVE